LQAPEESQNKHDGQTEAQTYTAIDGAPSGSGHIRPEPDPATPIPGPKRIGRHPPSRV
jgi:hypothetical protein